MTRKGKFFINFSPAVSNQATKAIRDKFPSWQLPQRSDKAIDDLSRMFNPIIRGWIQYYGPYYRSALYPTMRELDRDLALWAKRKYKKLRSHLLERPTGSPASRVALQSCSPTGRWGRSVAP
jgi:RNA-directed DNA polymerase